MSWKGFQKAVARAPQSLKGKVGMGEHTKDGIYLDAERRFSELEAETKKLHEDAKKYSSAVNGMLDHQVQFAEAVKDIYKPISGRMSDLDTLKVEGNPAGIEACEAYQAIVLELKETLAPELEMIETRIVNPAKDLLEVFKAVGKTTKKRNHKQVDYDRHRATLKKLQDKKEKTLKDEKALYKAETDVEASTQEYEYYNELLKADLPKMFLLESEFIRPLFQSFYYMQLNIFYTLNARMAECDIPYFNLDRDIVEAYNEKKGDTQERAEAIGICKFKLQRAPSKLGGPGGRFPNKASEARASSSDTASVAELPPYSAPGSSTGVARASSLAGKKAPPPPPTKPSALKKKEVAVALYDYAAQADGDLSFAAGDRIEVVQRTDESNDWWTGKLNGRQGVFPGNYVRLEI
ncbi:putative BAR adaptor protein RVS167 [Protomyces lactucae-debilis]|uniref:Putative BAR adaptor protein RVS167 n=1 Tax=Protomyces lactucae-debilis TaxID=2754530 RepID=A0A1Y2FUS5_PROLT|nr:putative BAR adaptor protein RVS167 [Protomyces lactucae-debilis]ORY87763.1 putative BAR adaptor protein RVS167 [Protomyces lactucae-debilis]